MRNPGLRLVGIRSSQGGRGGGGSFVTSGEIGDIGVFGNNRAEEELRLWLESRLDALGIDPVAYSRFVLSLLRHPDSALSPIHQQEITATIGRRNRARARSKIPNQGDREQRRAVVQCLTNAADQKCGVESLVDELCAKLRDLEGGGSNEDSKDSTQKLEDEHRHQEQQQQQSKNNLDSLTPRDRALRYYAAFPALQPATPKKNSNHKKEKNLGTNSYSFKNNNNHNNNNNNNNNYNKNRNSTSVGGNNKNNKTNTNSGNSNTNKGRYKKSKISIQANEPRRLEGKESSFSFAKSMEREREKQRELELDQLRLAQLQAKFDETLEALWDSGPGNPHDKASIWAAPSLSIPSGPLWPIDTSELPLILPLNDNSVSSGTTPYQESILDDSPMIPWDIDFTVGKVTEKVKEKDNLNWSEYVGEGPWSWKTLENSPKPTLFAASKTPTVNDTDEEDLLTSARTHFCPIKDDGNWADGTTFPVHNNFERVAYRRSESGNLFYPPGSESPYMEYRDEAASVPLSDFSLKFKVKQCDKSVQTDPIKSPVKRRIVTEEDHFYVADFEAEDTISREVEEDEAEDNVSFAQEQSSRMQLSFLLLKDRKRRHGSSFKCGMQAALRPLTL